MSPGSCGWRTTTPTPNREAMATKRSSPLSQSEARSPNGSGPFCFLLSIGIRQLEPESKSTPRSPRGERPLFNKSQQDCFHNWVDSLPALCRRSAAGSARRCQRRGRGFDPHRLLHVGCAHAQAHDGSKDPKARMCAKAAAVDMQRSAASAEAGRIACGHSRHGSMPG